MMITLNLGVCMHYIISIKKGLQTILNWIFGIRFLEGSRDYVVVRALTSHQCGPGSIPRSRVICGRVCWFSTLLREVLTLGTPVFSSPHKPI